MNHKEEVFDIVSFRKQFGPQFGPMISFNHPFASISCIHVMHPLSLIFTGCFLPRRSCSLVKILSSFEMRPWKCCFNTIISMINRLVWTALKSEKLNSCECCRIELSLTCRSVNLLTQNPTSEATLEILDESFKYLAQVYYVIVWAFLFQHDYAFKVQLKQ